MISLCLDWIGGLANVAVLADHDSVKFFLRAETKLQVVPIIGLSQNGYEPSPISRPAHG